MKTFKFLYITATALLFAACTNDNEGVDNGSLVAATVQADIFKTITRATVNNSWSENDAIGVYVTSAGYTTGNNVKYTTTLGDGKFESSSPIYFADATENTVFSAYYPYQKNVDDDGTIYNWSMAMVEEGVPCPADFLFASGATASKSSPQVKFTGDNNFKHCMSMIQLIIKAGNGINAEYANLKGDLSLKNIYTKGSVNTRTGGVTTTGERDSSIPFSVDNKSLKDDATCEFILFPQPLENNKMDIELNVAANGTINTYTTSLNSPTDNEFKGGNRYTYIIRVNNTGIVIENADITAWRYYDGGELDAEQQ